MDNNDKITELQNEIKRLSEEQEQSQIDKYNYLIGKCLHRATTSWEKITAIHRVDYDEYDGDEITFDCISIYYDERGSEYNCNCGISLDAYGSICAKYFEKQEITPEKFLSIFEATTNFIRTKINFKTE